MIVIKSKRSMASLNNQRYFTRHKSLENKGLTSNQNDAILKEQLELNFNK